MWLTRRERSLSRPAARAGVVTTGGQTVSVRADMERRAPEIAVPYRM